jgi:hypothetical protein
MKLPPPFDVTGCTSSSDRPRGCVTLPHVERAGDRCCSRVQENQQKKTSQAGRDGLATPAAWLMKKAPSAATGALGAQGFRTRRKNN